MDNDGFVPEDVQPVANNSDEIAHREVIDNEPDGVVRNDRVKEKKRNFWYYKLYDLERFININDNLLWNLCRHSYLPCVSLWIFTCGIAGLIFVAATVALIIGTALGPVYCTNASLPTFIALGLILLIILVCSCVTRIFERSRGYHSSSGLNLLFCIGCFLSVLFILAVVTDSIYIFRSDLSGPQSITGVCNEYGVTVYIAFSYFCALIVFMFCGCIWSYCIDLIKKMCCTVRSYNYSNRYQMDDRGSQYISITN